MPRKLEPHSPTGPVLHHRPHGRPFYLAAPGKASLVTCGDLIATGQKICIVESMKIPNDILSEVDGQIEEILCEDGQAVEYGQSLFRVLLP